MPAKRTKEQLKKNPPQGFPSLFQKFLSLFLFLPLLFCLTLLKIGKLPVAVFKTLYLLFSIFYHHLPFIPSWRQTRIHTPFSILHTSYSPPLALASLRSGRLARLAKQASGSILPTSFPLHYKLILSAIILLTLYTILLTKFLSQIPSPTELTSAERPLSTQVFDRKGRLLYQFYEEKNRKLTTLDKINPYLIQATLAIEDKNFYNHHGLDFTGILRALRFDLTSDSEIRQGGSTITQQLIKNTLLTPDQTIARKIKEVVLALWTESIYSKDQILTMYFNEIPYGGPTWGIETAANMYFGKSAKDLNLSESSYLAGLPAAPTQFSPYGINPEKGKERQKEVLRRMVEDKYITPDQAVTTYNEFLTFTPPKTDIKAPHFVMYIKSLLSDKYGARTVSAGGLKVTTTLDLDIQEMAESKVSQNIDQLAHLNVGNGAALVISASTNQILAMVGSKNYFDSKGGNFNATLSTRQPGSSIKPITYATAFKLGFTPGTILLDIPTTFPNQGGVNYSPVNYDGKFHGPVTIRTALGSSYNIPAVKTLATVGLNAMISTAKDMGITTFDDQSKFGLSLTLGGGGTKLIDLMTVYGTLASGGIKHEPVAILTITNSRGDIIEDNTKTDKGKRVLTEEVAYLVTNILADKNARIPAFGSNSLLDIPGYTVAVKTGTSDDKRDNLALGYTPEYVVGAWVGNNDYSPMNPYLASGITGATPIWRDIMDSLLEGQPNLSFERPEGIVEAMVDGRKDLAILGQVPKSVVFKQKIKKKDDKEKEIISFSDQFNSFIPEDKRFTQ